MSGVDMQIGVQPALHPGRPSARPAALLRRLTRRGDRARRSGALAEDMARHTKRKHSVAVTASWSAPHGPARAPVPRVAHLRSRRRKSARMVANPGWSSGANSTPAPSARKKSRVTGKSGQGRGSRSPRTQLRLPAPTAPQVRQDRQSGPGGRTESSSAVSNHSISTRSRSARGRSGAPSSAEGLCTASRTLDSSPRRRPERARARSPRRSSPRYT